MYNDIYQYYGATDEKIQHYAADDGVVVQTDPASLHLSMTAPSGHAISPFNNTMSMGRAITYGSPLDIIPKKHTLLKYGVIALVGYVIFLAYKKYAK